MLLSFGCHLSSSLEALAEDDRGALADVVLLGDPLLLELREASQDGCSLPCGVLVPGGVHLELEVLLLLENVADALLNAIGHAREEQVAAAEADVVEEWLSKRHINLLDALDDGVVESLNCSAMNWFQSFW
eukprot:GEZU01024100.1.p1 GENE.GEZU01024100.1~~GEZU01024100.1.p1  ORF type:complete len:131 (+),score=17.88 GEZU01024100.1:97-489(+)